MKTAFARHNISHLSASSINTYAAEPALWVMEKLLGRKMPVGCAAHRGNAAEAGVSMGLFDPKASAHDCATHALKAYDAKTALSGDSNRQKERDAIPGIVETALAELRQYGVPEPPPADSWNGQHKIEVMLPDVSVPFVGYLDFVFPRHGIIVDLKTQLRLASSITSSHARQGAIYVAPDSPYSNYEMRFAYTTPKKIGVYPLEDAKERLAEVREIAIRLERFLGLSDDPMELAALLVPNADSFYWNNDQAQAARREIYNL